ncbi:MAG: hypothetical protein ACREBQ_05445, partial [Nitrososphaerales archaeon]
MKAHKKNKTVFLALLGSLLLAICHVVVAGPARLDLTVDTSRTSGPIDLTRYALGQGGLSNRPMISDRINQIAQLHPQTIRLFVQGYFDLYPAHHQYHWDILDKAIEAILATGAKPII